ncbi:MAG: glycosyltransferase [Gammaproteobacteria bacterium]|nr:glycosyltransferase [Gammaproteobacteria bacterium]
MRLVTFTNLYPSVEMPRHGIFVEERLRHLVASGRIDAEVCALRPRTALSLGSYCGSRPHHDTETRRGIQVNYLPVPTLPLVTNWIDPLLWARASRELVTDLIGTQRNDVILDAHFLYPDGVAAVILGRSLGVPVVMTARGSDVNVKCANAVMRRWVCWATKRCDAVITVSRALSKKLIRFGVSEKKIEVLRNGVDLERFQPRSGEILTPNKTQRGVVLLSAGHLVDGKGHHIAIEAISKLPDATLLIVGEGPKETELRDLAINLGVASRVRFLGYVPHERMAEIYSVANFTILASANEGMPNVILESLACGTRVVATNVGGVGEVITASVAGALMASRHASEVVESIRMLAESKHERRETRSFAEQFGWEDTIRRQVSLYERVASK